MKWIFLAFITLVVFSSYAFSSCENPRNASIATTISNPELAENSGIDFSRSHYNVFWTLNDANNTNEIFAIDINGKNLGSYEIQGAENIDWEDITVAACFDNTANDCIYIADTGNNKLKRKEFQVYVVEEPADFADKALPLKQKITFKVRGEYNFEAFSVNEETKEFYLVSKGDKKSGTKNSSVVFSLAEGATEAKALTTIDFTQFSAPLDKDDMIVTSSDFNAPTQTLLLGTYGKAFEVQLNDLADFNTKARALQVPKMEKSESIAYHLTSRGLAIFTSSEGLNQPLYKISCE